MKKCNIWYISENDDLPAITNPGFIETEIKKLGLNDSNKINISGEDCNIFLICGNFSLSDEIIQNKKTAAVFLTKDNQLTKSKNRKIHMIESPLRKNEIQYILEVTIQWQYYKMTAEEISESCLSNVGFFEGVFNLARNEYAETKKESEAYKQLLNYENQLKGYQDNIQTAFEKILGFKDSELIQLKERLNASEKLDNFREQELLEALKEKNATEQALEYSRIEEMNMDKMIHAQNNLFDYTARQIKDLMEENKRLKDELKNK